MREGVRRERGKQKKENARVPILKIKKPQLLDAPEKDNFKKLKLKITKKNSKSAWAGEARGSQEGLNLRLTSSKKSVPGKQGTQRELSQRTNR